MLFLYLFILLQGSEATLERPCSKEMSRLLRNPQETKAKGTLRVTSKGVIYPQGFFWKEGADYWGCPCNVTRCLRLCAAGGESNPTAHDHSVISKPFNLTIRNNTSDVRVTSHDHFTVLEGQRCPKNHIALPLNSSGAPVEKHVILSNGSLLLTKLNTVLGPEQFCLYHSGGRVVTVVCVCETTVATMFSTSTASTRLQNYILILYTLFFFKI